MALFETALQKTLLNEGGYINDPADPDRKTWKGVARKIFNTDLQIKVHDFYQSNFRGHVQGDRIADHQVSFFNFRFCRHEQQRHLRTTRCQHYEQPTTNY